jgi:hypothetical protein
MTNIYLFLAKYIVIAFRAKFADKITFIRLKILMPLLRREATIQRYFECAALETNFIIRKTETRLLLSMDSESKNNYLH